MKFRISFNEVIFIVVLITIGILTRTVLHIKPNVEFVTGATLVASYFLKDKKIVPVVPLGIMIITDLIIGNSNILWFTWSGFLVMIIIPLLSRIKIIKSLKGKINPTVWYTGFGFSTGLIGTLWFYVWTNLGVVIMGTMYAHNLNGLMHSYINALPFLYNQLIGNMFIVPSLFLASYMYFEFVKDINMKLFNLYSYFFTEKSTAKTGAKLA